MLTRAKSNTQFRRRYSNPVDRSKAAVICDRVGVLTVFYFSKDYPTALRRVVVKGEAGKRITFLTNNFASKPEFMAGLYRQRWKVELFFTHPAFRLDRFNQRQLAGPAMPLRGPRLKSADAHL